MSLMRLSSLVSCRLVTCRWAIGLVRAQCQEFKGGLSGCCLGCLCWSVLVCGGVLGVVMVAV